MNVSPRIISVLGAECTGKTQLCAALGVGLSALVVPEFLRSWCDEKQRAPEQREQALIIEGQLDAERAACEDAWRAGVNWVVVDSSPLMTAIYSLEYFDDETPCAQALAHQQRYSLSLVADAAIPWLAEGWQRDSAQRRASAQSRLLQILKAGGLPFDVIAGEPARRLQLATQIVNALPAA